MRMSVVLAMTVRCFRATLVDKGRITELVVFPLSFLIIWGLFFASGMVERVVASQLLIINLIWSASGTFQTQANLTLMFDLWAREFSNILRQGVRIEEMIVSHLLFSTVIGLLNLAVFTVSIVVVFGGGLREVIIFAELFPHYYLSSIGLAALFGGIVIKLGRSYGFIAWTGLQFLIMLSSPFSPVSSLPGWLAALVRLSPFTSIFEYVRYGLPADYWRGLGLAIVYLLGGSLAAAHLYRNRRAVQGLMDV